MKRLAGEGREGRERLGRSRNGWGGKWGGLIRERNRKIGLDEEREEEEWDRRWRRRKVDQMKQGRKDRVNR